MTRRYTREDLLYLRQSSLVSKPTGLLPTEEWMGPLPESAQRRPPNRGKADENVAHEPGNRRPLFDRRPSRASTNVPEDIVLGPPKTAFASASGSRNPNRTFDSPSRGSFGGQAEDNTRGDRQSFRERFSRQPPKSELEGERSQEPKSGNLHYRRSTNDHEPRLGRQEGSTGEVEGERMMQHTSYKDQEKSRGSEQDGRILRGSESHQRDPTEEGNHDTRRNGQGRGRGDAAWHRQNKETDNLENKKDNPRSKAWRDKDSGGGRGSDRDWHKNVKQEQNPEWMDEPEYQEKKHAHTQEDFERWKERMKAGNTFTPETNDTPPRQRPDHERTVSGISINGGKSKAETPLVVDQSFDGFFGLWNEPAKKATNEAQEQQLGDVNKAKGSKTSKFTNFFGVSAPTQSRPESEISLASPPEASRESSSEDKEGFQRILKLLDQQQTTPKNSTVPEPMIRNMPAAPSMHGGHASLNWDSSTTNMMKPKPGQDNPPLQNRDSEFLLKLMQQPRASAQANNSHVSSNNGPGLLPLSNLMLSPQQAPGTGPPPGFSDEGTKEDLQSRDKLNPGAISDRRGPPPGLFDGLRSVPKDSQRMGKNGPEFAPSMISQNPPLRYGMMPPPGFQAPLRTPTQFPPGLMNPPSSGDRGNPYGMRIGGKPPPPPGMPPPGFVNAAPPGFSPVQYSPEGPGRMFFGGAVQRSPMEGFGEMGHYEGGQQGMLPGQFRRQE